MLTHLNLAEGRHNVFQLKCFSLAGKCPKMVHFFKQNIESVLCQKNVRTRRTENGNLFEKESIFVEERKEMEEIF